MDFDCSGFSILHGEDDPADAELMRRLLKRIEYSGGYVNLKLGQEIVAWHQDLENPLPGLIFLDIGLPGIDGKSILSNLRKEERTMSVPIIMMSGSSSLRDYRDCIHLGANGYIRKTSDRDLFERVCQNFIQGWAQLADQKFF